MRCLNVGWHRAVEAKGLKGHLGEESSVSATALHIEIIDDVCIWLSQN